MIEPLVASLVSLGVSLMIRSVDVVRDRCIGCGTCWVSHPNLFEEDNSEQDLKARPTGGLADESTLHTAAVNCPTLAILLIDESGATAFPTEADLAERENAGWF
jgi:ferredoxin